MAIDTSNIVIPEDRVPKGNSKIPVTDEMLVYMYAYRNKGFSWKQIAEYINEDFNVDINVSIHSIKASYYKFVRANKDR